VDGGSLSSEAGARRAVVASARNACCELERRERVALEEEARQRVNLTKARRLMLVLIKITVVFVVLL
jgi:hypothetical protein